MDDLPKVTARHLRNLKQGGSVITMITGYDTPSARLIEAAGIDVVLVGDSVATTVLGYDSTTQLPLGAMLHHVAAVARGLDKTYLLADLPACVSGTPEAAVAAARQLVAAGARGIKLEGERPDLTEALAAAEIEAWGHLGYTPQLIETPRKQGKTPEAAARIMQAARQLEATGIVGLIVELVPEKLGHALAQELAVPVVGIGAGDLCDGQVQVWHDVVGLSEVQFRHAMRLGNWHAQAQKILSEYAGHVRARSRPLSCPH
jgi:3-methyl-2-oxobutanoate hydroxymethyltransferase